MLSTLLFALTFSPQPKQTKKRTGKKVAAAPYQKTATKKVDPKKNPLFEKKPHNYGIGQAVQPKRDLTRFVKWPKYVRLQRQKRVLLSRLKVPPSINQFTRTLDKSLGKNAITKTTTYLVM